MTSDRELMALAEQIGKRMVSEGARLTTAESCTGGWIAKVITDVPGSSGWFEFGYVSYANIAKRVLLGVGDDILLSHGAVSEAAVRAMAQGALEASGADLAVAVSGIAGPDGGVPGKPVGTVWFGWARRRDRNTDLESLVEHFRGDREAVRREAVARALNGLLAF